MSELEQSLQPEETVTLRLRPDIKFRDRTNDPFFAAVAAEREGFVLTAGSYQLVQLYTRRPVLLCGALDTLPYAPESGPAMENILRDVYGADLLNPPEIAHGRGVLPREYRMPAARPLVDVMAEPASWRGAGGIVRDVTEDLADDTLVLVCEGTRLPPASLAKLMTALVVLDSVRSADVVTVSRRAARARGARVGLTERMRMSAEDLVVAMLLASANDACLALAEHAAGDADAFVARMNREAETLGLAQTRYFDPHGLGRNHTSARDLTVLGRRVMQNEVFREIVRTRRHTYEVTDADGQRRTVVWNNTNRLLDMEGYDGIKTGTTSAAGACLVASGRRGTDHLYIVVLGSTSSDGARRRLHRSTSSPTHTGGPSRWSWPQKRWSSSLPNECRCRTCQMPAIAWSGSNSARPATRSGCWTCRRINVCIRANRSGCDACSKPMARRGAPRGRRTSSC